MSASSLPPRPNLRQLQVQAKELLRAHRDGEGEACTRIHAGLPRLEHLNVEEVSTVNVSLQEVQHVLAREYGYRTWSELREAAGSASSSADPEELRAAIDSDDLAAVRMLAETHPELLDQRWIYESLDGERSITDTPFGYAVLWNRRRVVGYLLETGAPLERGDNSGLTLEERLRQAIDIDDGQWIRQLLDARPDLLHTDVPGPNHRLWVTMDREQGTVHRVPPLCFAVGRPKLNAVRVLLDAGADIHVRNDLPIRNAVSGGGNVAVMEMLVEAGWDPSTGTGQMLQDAAENLRPELVRFLTSHGVGPDVYAEDGGTALDMALNTYVTGPGRAGCIDVLIEAGAGHADNAAFDLLRGRLDLLEQRTQVDPECISRHYDLRQGREHYGHTYGGGSYGAPLQDTTLLHMCAHYGYLEGAQFLLDRGADPNVRALPERSGCNHPPIFHAVTSNWNYSYPVLELLLESGAAPDLRATIRIDDGRVFKNVTPLEYAIEFPKEPYDILPEGGVGSSHEPHRRVVELLQKMGEE